MVARTLKFLIAGFFLYWLFTSGRLDFHGLADTWFTPPHLPILLVVFVNHAAQLQRWRFLLKTQQIIIPLWPATRIFWIAQFFILASLGVAAGEAVRGYYIARYAPNTKTAGISTVLADRILGLYTQLLLGGLALLLLGVSDTMLPGATHIGEMVLLLLLGMTLALVLPYLPWSRALLGRFLPARLWEPLHGVMADYVDNRRGVAAAAAASVISTVTVMAAFHLISVALGTPIGLLETFLVVPLVIIVNSVPISIGGLGVGETAAEMLMAQIGLTGGGAVMLFLRVSTWFLILPGGLLLFALEKGALEKGAVDLKKEALQKGTPKPEKNR